MSIFFDYYNLSLFLGGIIALLAGLVVYISDRKKLENVAWLSLNICTAIWSFGYFLMISTSEKGTASVSNWILHAAAIFIPTIYFFFITALTKTFDRFKKAFDILGLLIVFFLLINSTPLFVKNVIPKFIFNFAPDAGPLYIYFALYFFGVVLLSFYVLIRKIWSSDKAEALRLRFVLYSSIVGFIGGGSVFFLTFNVNFPPYPIVFFSFYPVIIAYAMLRYNLFNIKIISTQLLTASIWIILLFRTILSENQNEQIISAVLLVFTVILGVFLIRNVYKEVEQREKIEILAKELDKANERLKEFLSLATHQIRAPIAAIRGYASEILEGDFGEVTPTVRETVEIIASSSGELAHTVQDFLDISRIEQNSMKYDYTDFDLNELVQSTVNDLKPNIEKKKLSLNIELANEPLPIKGDRGKLQQVLANVIDNSSKYTPQGSITISTKVEDGKSRITVKDTGIGIKPETMGKLFQKFSRAEDATKANILGTGLGLYLARQLVEAQNGKIWAESEGDGKGSTFIIELPKFKA